jgi:hypothetical protein
MKLYIASASAGGRCNLRDFVSALAVEHFVFAPCLGFAGVETLEVRESVMGVCSWVVQHWAEVLIVYYEGVGTVGSWEELALAKTRIPTAVFVSSESLFVPKEACNEFKFRNVPELMEWLNVISKDS